MQLPSAIRQRITQDAINTLQINGVRDTANAHLFPDVLERGTKLQALGQELEVDEPAALVLVDLMPSRNWAHPCEWHLYAAENGSRSRIVKAHFPPHLIVRESERLIAVNAPVKPVDTANLRQRRSAQNPTLNVLTNHPGTRYAILYSGASNNRHVNDLEFLYRTLLDVYGFDPNNVFVLNHDGTLNYNGGPKPVQSWPGDSTPYRMPVNGQGTRAGMQSVLTTLAGSIRESDLLFIHTNNHGAGPGDGVTDFCLCAYSSAGWEAYYVSDFVADLATLPAFDTLMVMMEQCRSGGFVTPVINNSRAARTHICTAVHPPDYSLGGANFDQFAEDWIAGVTGHYPDGTGLTQVVDANGDGRISTAEAFAYADAVHHQGDTPMAGDSPAGQGSYIFLGQPSMAALSCYAVADFAMRVYFLDANYHVNELAWMGGRWVNTGDLTARTGAAAAAAGSAVPCYAVADHAMRVYFLDANYHVNELAWMGGRWVNTGDLTARTGAAAAAADSPLSCYAVADHAMRVYFLDANYHVNELAWMGGRWVNTGDLTARTGAAAAAADSPLSCYAVADMPCGCTSWTPTTMSTSWRGWAADGSTPAISPRGPARPRRPPIAL